jgi:hypothetical protein
VGEFRREWSDLDAVAFLRRVVAEEDRGVIRDYLPPGLLKRLLAMLDAPPPPVTVQRKRGKKK